MTPCRRRHERPPTPAPERLQRGLAGLALLGALTLLAAQGAQSPSVSWVWQRGDAVWITDPRPVEATVQQWGSTDIPVARFVRRFDWGGDGGSPRLVLRAARAWQVFLDGELVAASPDPDPDWRRDRTIDLGSPLRIGENELVIAVWNPRGPPLLRARIELSDRTLATGPDWTVRRGDAAEVPVMLPDDTRPHPSAALGPRPGEALREKAAMLLGFLGVFWLLWYQIAASRRIDPGQAPGIALVLSFGAWLALFFGSFLDVPIASGFDATKHLRFIEMLREERVLPRPDAGWSTYHPPLYFALVAVLREAGESLGAAQQALLTRLPSFVSGLAQIWIARHLALRLLPGRPVETTAAIAFAACLPVSIYSSAYVSNEALHAAAFGLAVLLCVRALVRPTQIRDLLALGTALGVALLLKVTALALAAVAGAVLVARATLIERARPARIAAVVAAVSLPALAVAGWWYLRNWQLYGSLFLANWGDLPGQPWWSHPGFRTWDYYLGFGASLRRPVFAGFESLLDALYSSTWGDGWIAGRGSAAFLPEAWNWTWAAVGYWLALPVSLTLLVGVVGSVRLAFRVAGRRAAWSFVLLLELALGTAFVLLTLELPYFGQAKASYLLGLVAPIAVQFALGAAAVENSLSRWGGAPAVAGARALWSTAGLVFLLSFAGGS